MIRFLAGVFSVAVCAFAQNPNMPVFPGGIATDNNLLVSSDNAITSLSSSITATATSIPTLSATNFIAPTALTIGSELIFCPTLSSNTFTGCTRGWLGTTAAAYPSGTLVSQNIISYFLNQRAAEIKAIETALGTNFAGGGINSHTAPYILTGADNGLLQVFNSATGPATLPAAPPSAKWQANILNLNATTLTVSPNGLLVNGLTAAFPLGQFQSARIWTDGTNYYAAATGGPAIISSLPGTSGTALCSESITGVSKTTVCFLSAYANTGTPQTYSYPVAFSATPVLLESSGSCGAYNPTTTAGTLTLPANAAMTPETCNVVAIGQ